MVLLKSGKNDGIALYISKETILKEIAAKIEQVKLAFLFWPSTGSFQQHLVHPVESPLNILQSNVFPHLTFSFSDPKSTQC
jgi:hypothetical protein